PVDLPAPDPANKGAKDKPVKVYILSGQSNMLGFGKLEGSQPLYSHVFLSADPSVKDCKLPVDNALLLRFDLYQSAETGAETGGVVKGSSTKLALGSADAKIPVSDGPVEVEAFIEVPHDGTYRIHPAGEAVVKINGKVVESDGDAKLTKGKRHPLSITYTKGGGSASLWMEKTDLEGMGDLRWVVEKLGRFPYLTDDKGEWTVRHDVMLNDAYMGKGKSDPLSGPACGPTFGPELGFGYVMGEWHDEPVIVMKADIGNRSLGWDILPEGSKSYTHDGQNYPGYREMLDDDGNVVKWDGEGWYAGKQYDEYTEAVRAVLDNFDEKYPEYADQGFEVAGFVWWQGHKDGGNPGHIAHYEQNLVNLIKAWRKEFDAPNAKWAIATVGFDGENMPENYIQVAKAQMAVADPERHPELAGTVKTIDARPFWREPGVSPKNQGYHYNHNGETYMLVGDALGRAMVELHGGKVEYPSPELDPSIVALPVMWATNNDELKPMSAALRPIILDKLAPEYVVSAPGTPAYRRKGLPLEEIVEEKLSKPTAQLTSQL
ncbi:MAG: sialate O-acetylesterase, partial [Haloferula sp.]